MDRLVHLSLPQTGTTSFATLMQRLGELFFVRDVMIPVDQVEYVRPHDLTEATRLVNSERFSVIPASEDGLTFPTVFDTRRPEGSVGIITEERATTIADCIPDWTPLADALTLFQSREWYLTIEKNQVSGLITYWAFNRHEFRVQLYVALSYLEELSRNVLANDGCGVTGPEGLHLTDDVLRKAQKRFEGTCRELGGNRLVDELDFHNVHDALRKHQSWRDFLNRKTGSCLSNGMYDKLYCFTKLRDLVMHGRLLFPTYRHFEDGLGAIDTMMGLIDNLTEYHSHSGLSRSCS